MLGEGGQTALERLEPEAGQWCAAGEGWEHEELHVPTPAASCCPSGCFSDQHAHHGRGGQQVHVQHLPLLLGQEGGPVIPPLEVPLKNAVFIFLAPGMGKVLITMCCKLFSVSSIVYTSIIANSVISEMLNQLHLLISVSSGKNK